MIIKTDEEARGSGCARSDRSNNYINMHWSNPLRNAFEQISGAGLRAGDSSGVATRTGTSISTSRWSAGADRGELLVGDQDGFQEFVLLGIGEEIAGEQFAGFLGRRFVPG